MWICRPARPDEAEAACGVIRQSIEQLCRADHDDDPAILARWLANKTPGQVKMWIELNPCGVLVAVASDGIAGVGAVLRDGRIVLNYVAPWARFQGVSKSLVRAMETRAAASGHALCTLTSTVTAHAFYRGCGYEDAGEPIRSFGGKPAFPMRRAIA